jgi:hypothetical protein
MVGGSIPASQQELHQSAGFRFGFAVFRTCKAAADWLAPCHPEARRSTIHTYGLRLAHLGESEAF